MASIPLVLFLSVLNLFQTQARVGAATVQIFANDTSAIQYSSRWVGPTMFQLEPGIDDPNAVGANSSVCSIPEVSMYSSTDGESFTFSFHGVGVQLVLSSRPDHSPFGVSIDGGPEELRDSYSVGARCGVAWSREGLKLGNHTVRTTAHIAIPRVFLELLSIIYDDGSDIVVPPSTTTSQSSLVSSSSASVSSSSPADTCSLKSSAVLPTNTAAHDQSSSPRGTLTRGAVVGIATCAGLTALLGLMVLVLLWRRRTRGSYLHPYPTSTTGSGLGSSTLSVAVEKSLKSPIAQSRAVLPNGEVPLPTNAITPSRSSAPAPEPEALRLAPEDIDRIAARIVLATARLGDSDATALPPY